MAAVRKVGADYIVLSLYAAAVKEHDLRAAYTVHRRITGIFAHGRIFKLKRLLNDCLAVCVVNRDACARCGEKTVVHRGIALIRPRCDIVAFNLFR